MKKKNCGGFIDCQRKGVVVGAHSRARRCFQKKTKRKIKQLSVCVQVKIGATPKKSSQRSWRDFNSGPPKCKSSALTTRPRCLLLIVFLFRVCLLVCLSQWEKDIVNHHFAINGRNGRNGNRRHLAQSVPLVLLDQ